MRDAGSLLPSLPWGVSVPTTQPEGTGERSFVGLQPQAGPSLQDGVLSVGPGLSLVGDCTRRGPAPSRGSRQPSLRPHWGLWGMCLCFLVRSFPREAAARGSPPDLGGGCSGRGTAPLSCLITWSSGRDAGGFQSPCPTPIPPHSPPSASVPPCPPSSPSTHVPSRPSFPSCCVLISDLPADLKANAEFFYS